MAVARNAARAANKLGLTLNPNNHHLKRLLCSTNPNSLLMKLIQEPNSRIKARLDIEANCIHNTSDFAWDSLVTALRSSSPQKVQLVLEWRLEKMLEMNERNDVCYSELISLCAKVQKPQVAMLVFTSMEATGVKPRSAVFNALIRAWLSSGNIMTALSLFEIMGSSEDYKPDSDTYNIFISFYSEMGNQKSMLAWYSAKTSAGFSTDIQAYESLISGCTKSKNFDMADKFYKEMVLSGIEPSMKILESKLQGYCEQRKFGQIKGLLMSMFNSGWEISEKLAVKAIRLYSELGTIKEMEALLSSLTKSNPNPEILQLLHCQIIRMHAMSDRLDDLEYEVGRMLKQGVSFKSPDDVEKIICSYFRREAYDRLDLFLERISDSYKLNRSTYDLLISGYKRAGLSRKLDMVMEDMAKAGYL
ncbi:Pentatricopeptide repeat [Dillenia turbinata]|uniref:Pentatricopeptide repeat n=1 Tax=Dillenia turbinata TaxID=194707 RepID=A0AAN8YTS1_9MAGN